MKLLVTGASGFIGGHLLRAAVRAYGADNVIAFSSRPHPLCETIVYDRGDFSVGAGSLASLAEVDVLVHAGAFTPKRAADANSPDGCNANILFTDRLLRLPFAKLAKIVYLSTLDVYAPAAKITESTPTIPATLYGQSKLYCEAMVAAFAATMPAACQVLRIGHVYGPGEEQYAKFLPVAVSKIVAGEPVELWGDGSELRSLIYIDDVVTAILNSILLPGDVGTINVTGGLAVPIREILDRLIAISGRQVEVLERDRQGAKRDLVFDNRKCMAHLLAEETDLSAGLRAEYQHVAGLG